MGELIAEKIHAFDQSNREEIKSTHSFLAKKKPGILPSFSAINLQILN